ncbi:MAG: DUF4838 domain-containing protein [Kiritimatiellae bacterium]|nr:DUF4838 domain-containing protein [Kiritimatiellia bacterium]
MNRYKKNQVLRSGMLYLAVVWLSFAAIALADKDLTLACDGKSDYLIVIPDKATVVERTAAGELQKYLAEVTGATLPIFTEANAPHGKPGVVVGNGTITSRLLAGLRPNSLGPDAIVIRTVGRDLILTGHPRRGTLYAVYTFLEDTVGIRWWTITESHIPKCPTLRIPPLDIVYHPKVIDRATRYLQLSDGCFVTKHPLVTAEEQRAMGIFSARLRLNGHDHYSIPNEYGGPNGLIGWVHTFYQINGLLPVAEYFDKHPEWYSLIKGERRKEHSQLCLTNEEMRKEVIRVVKERIRQNPGATMISISQNDWHGYCECDKCKALEEHEGAHSGPLIHFINAVAEEVEKEFPDILIETLAYQYTRVPPKYVKPRRNVVIRLCSIECSFTEPLADGTNEANVSFRHDMEGWGRISSQLYIWDYVTNFADYLSPHPNFPVLAPNLRYFVKNGAIGIFEQGDSGCRVGHFVRLRAWYLAHLLWNPDADEKKLFETFMNGYYGAAAPYLIQSMNVIDEAGRRAKIPVRCYMRDTSGWLPLADLTQASELFNKAAAAVADNPELAERVCRERMSLDYVWLQRYDSLHREARRSKSEFRGPENPQTALTEFRALLDKYSAGEYRQGRIIPADFGNEFSFIARQKIPAGNTPEECEGLARADWIDLQEADYIPRSEPKLFSIDKDDAASNGLTRRMPNVHQIWACHSYPLGDYGVTSNSRCRVYLRVRCDAKTDDGAAMTAGIYDDALRRAVTSKQISVKAIRGKQYQSIDLGIHSLGEQMYVWAAPVIRDKTEVQAAYVDRVFLVRCEQSNAAEQGKNRPETEQYAKTQPDALRVGLARVCITPEKPMWLHGYATKPRFRPSEGKLNDLYAQAMAIADARGERAVLITVDLCILRGAEAKTLFDRLTKKTGLQRRQLLVNFSHTHSGPIIGTSDLNRYPMSTEDQQTTIDYTLRLYDQIADLAQAALADLKPATLAWGTGRSSFVRNRRLYKEDGSYRGMGPNANKHVDDIVPALRVNTPEGKLRAIVFGCACHPVTLGDSLKISGDYVSFAKEKIESDNPGVQAMFVQGCGADANSDPRCGPEAEKNVRLHGENLAAEVCKIVQGPLKPVRGPLKVKFSEVDLPLKPAPPSAELAKMSGVMAYNAKRILTAIERGEPLPSHHKHPLALWQFGEDLIFVALSGEVVSGYVPLIKQALGAGNLWIAGYSNEIDGYLPDATIVAEGGYEARGLVADIGFYSAEAEKTLVKAVQDLRNQ